MATWIILLRGVMPTGRNKVPMTPLREALEDAGLARVRTYIQSGNVLADSRLGQRKIEQLVHDVIADRFGGDITVMARTPREIAALVEANPFGTADPGKLFLTLLGGEPDPDRVRDVQAMDISPDAVAFRGNVVYTRVAHGYRTLKANNTFLEKRLKVKATTRVLRTIDRLLALAES